jgi:hypothetical protein
VNPNPPRSTANTARLRWACFMVGFNNFGTRRVRTVALKSALSHEPRGHSQVGFPAPGHQRLQRLAAPAMPLRHARAWAVRRKGRHAHNTANAQVAAVVHQGAPVPDPLAQNQQVCGALICVLGMTYPTLSSN